MTLFPTVALERATTRSALRYDLHRQARTSTDHVADKNQLAFYTINPDIKVIAPWRDPTFL